MVITGLARNQLIRKGPWVRIPPSPPYAGLFAIMRKVFFRENQENEASGGGFERCLYARLTPSGQKLQTHLCIRLDRIFVCLLKPKMGAWKQKRRCLSRLFFSRFETAPFGILLRHVRRRALWLFQNEHNALSIHVMLFFYGRKTYDIFMIS